MGKTSWGICQRVIVREPTLCSDDFLSPNVLAGIKQNIVTVVDANGFTAAGVRSKKVFIFLSVGVRVTLSFQKAEEIVVKDFYVK